MVIPNDEVSLLALARKFEGEGFPLKALSLCKHGAQLHPGSRELIEMYARLSAGLEEGIASGAVHVDRKPSASPDPEVMFRQAEVYLKYSLREKAIATLREVLELAPEHAAARALLSSLD